MNWCDTNQDGFYDQLYMLGSRSFAIWTNDWQLVFDSGDQLEWIAAQAVPQFFNTADDETRFDQKSDERGPEPEELAVGQVSERQYVFVAPERIGGLYVYDITNPKAPIFQQYINYRNFAINPAAVCEKNPPKLDQCSRTGDLGPEGILFIAADQSPIGVPLVVITNEVSDSTTLYRVDPSRTDVVTLRLVGLASDGSIWYTTDLAHWINIPGRLTSLVSSDLNGDGRADLAGLSDGAIWYTTDLSNWTNIPGWLTTIISGNIKAP